MKASSFKSIVTSYDTKNIATNKVTFSQYMDQLKDHVYSLKIERSQFPLEIFVELTNRCNLDCIYCYKKATNSRNNDSISLEAIKKLAKNIGHSPSTFVILEGGEPLLHPEFVEIFSEFKKYSIPVEIITNGTCLDEKILSQIYDKFDKNYDDFQISLDGINEYNMLNRGINVDKVLKSIKLLNDVGIVPRINCVVTNKNYLGIIEFVKYLNDNYKINSLSFNTPIGKNLKHLILEDTIAKDLHKSIMDMKNVFDFPIFGSPIKPEQDCNNYNNIEETHMRCTAMRSKLCISANGDIYPCVFMENKIKPFGNIITDDLNVIWKSKESEVFTQNLIEKNRKCSKCKNAKYCPQQCAGGQ